MMKDLRWSFYIFIIRILNRIIRIVRGSVSIPQHDRVKKVAVLQMSGIGDLLLGTPALSAIGEIFPNSEIDIITYSKKNAAFLLRIPKIKDIIEFKLFDLSFSSIWKPAFWRRILNPVQKIRKRRYDFYINLHNPWLPQWSLMEMLLAVISGARLRVGINPYFMDGRGFFDVYVSEMEIADKHFPDFYLEIIQLLGIFRKGTEILFPIDLSEKRLAEKSLMEWMPKKKGYVCLHSGATSENKRWPARFFRELGRRLCKLGYGVVLIGTESEKKLADFISKDLLSESLINAAGKTSLFEMAAIIEHCDLFIGNDSGPLHIAIARKRPVIGLVLQEIPRYHRYTTENTVLMFSNPSWPLYKENPFSEIAAVDKNYKLKWNISVDQVYQEALRLLPSDPKD